jgi:hypothetical protein
MILDWRRTAIGSIVYMAEITRLMIPVKLLGHSGELPYDVIGNCP